MLLSRSLGALVLISAVGVAAAAEPVAPFGLLKTTHGDVAKQYSGDWLRSVGKDPAAVEALWASDRPVLDRVAATFALGDPEAARLLDGARHGPPPTDVPPLLRDTTKPIFYRANLALAYGQALSRRRIYEEALAVLALTRPEQVVDPAAFLFHKAVAEHALLKGDEAARTAARLLEDTPDAPERYRHLAFQISEDLKTWKKDLGAVARLMDNAERRLSLTRGGPTTKKIQKTIVARLDEMIKERERPSCDGDGNGGGCPDGGSAPKPGRPDAREATAPLPDSVPAGGSGPGNVDPKKLKEMAEVWGKLPDKERARAMLDLTRDVPSKYRRVIEDYFKALGRGERP